MDINKTCCFTGKRPQSFPFRFDETDNDCVNLKNKLYDKIELAIMAGYRNFITGMALGVDTWAAEAVLELKSNYPQIKLICAIPYKDQPVSWTFDQQKRYKNILKQSDEQIILDSQNSKEAYFARNRYMVDNSSLVIAICDNPPTGGTAYTIRYAKSLNKKIVIINF